jgi:Bacterial Ig domain
LLQVRWLYHQSAFEDQNAVYSTAYNADYYGSVWRRCYNGEYTWLNTVERGATYAAGDVDGCLGVWFSGRWRTAPALEYIAKVRANLDQRVWESDVFKNASAPSNTPINPTPNPPSDTTAPTVSLTAPTAGQTVGGTINITAAATDTQSAISAVRFYLDGSSLPFSTDSTAPFSVSWNSATVTNGSHNIIARATDTAGNTGASSTLTFTVNNTVVDTTKPTTAITDPANAATIIGTKVVLATATDNVGVSRVELLIDGIVRATDTTSPYSFSWASTTYSDGPHTLQTRVFDAANNQNVSAIVNVTVDNVVEPTPKTGDVNGDGLVNKTDMRILLANYGTIVTPFTSGDLDGSGFVDRTDRRILQANYGS